MGAQQAAPLRLPSRLHVLVIPGEIPLQPVPPEAEQPDVVVLVGVDDELGRHAEAPQRLVHLLRVEERHVEVLVAAQEQRGCGDAIGVQERRRELDPRGRAPPGESQLRFVFAHVLVGAEAREDVRRTRAADRGSEAAVLSDHVVREDAAVAPAPDAEPARIGPPLRHRVVDRGQHVLRILVAPVREDRDENCSPRPELPRGFAATTRYPRAANNWNEKSKRYANCDTGPPWMRSSAGWRPPGGDRSSGGFTTKPLTGVPSRLRKPTGSTAPSRSS